MLLKITFVTFLLDCFLKVEGWSCASTVSKVFSHANTNAIMWFDISADINQEPVNTYSVRFHNNSLQAIVIYSNGGITTDKIPGVDIAADTSGYVLFTKTNVGTNNAGIYFIGSSTTPTRCTCLYILGTPTKPSLSINNSPSVGGSVTLSCQSTSTTTLSNHSLGFMYNWRVDNTDNPSGSRYSYSNNRKTLTLSNIVKDDVNKQFTCTATEDVNNGYTSSRSDLLSIDIHYGPENVQFSPATTHYETAENTNIDSVTCIASCNPQCNFKWNKVGRSTAVSNNAVLSLGVLSSSKAGTYRCTAERSGGPSVTKDLTVNVIYGPSNMYFTPSTTSYRYNENANPPSITCGSSCWLCQYRWTGPNSYSSSGPVLDLDSLTRNMHGQYTCTASNTKDSSQGQQQKKVTIEVRYGPDSVRVTPTQLTYTVDEGSTLTNIKCAADCFPACSYRWTEEGQNGAVSDTDTLTLGEIQRAYSGNYTCTATNGDVTSMSKDIKVAIVVRYGPYDSSTVLSPADKDYIRNEDSTGLPDIRCSADCYPSCTYTWTKLRQGQTTTIGTTNGVLSRGSIKREDAGTYTCTATNPGKSRSLTTTKAVTVRVRYGPDTPSISVKSPYTVTEGDMADDITCSSDCYPGCNFHWTNVSSGSSIGSSDVLSLETVNRYMVGSYKCTASNTAREYRVSTDNTLSVIVRHAPDVRADISTSNLTEGVNVSLFCIGSGYPANYTNTGLTQTVNSVVIPNNNTALKGTPRYSSMHFKPLHFHDTGRYTCTLNNNVRNTAGILDQTGSVDVIVKVLPKVLIGEVRFTGATGGNAQLQVPVYSYPDLEPITITRYDGVEIISNHKYILSVHHKIVTTNFYGTSVSLDGSTVNFAILDLKEDDFGNYSLKLKNSLGSIAVKMLAIAEGPPSSPKNFDFLPEYESPTFVWEKNFNGGLEQSFVIQTAVSRTEQWVNHTNINEKDPQHQINSTFYKAKIKLQPGIYIARITANNSRGESDAVELGYSFEIFSEEGIENSSKTTQVVVGVVSSLVLVAVIVVSVFIWKKRLEKKEQHRREHNDQETEGRTATDNSYYNVSSIGPNADESRSGTQYEDLQGITASDPSRIYEQLQKQNKNISPYAELSSTSLVSSRGDVIYENLKLNEMPK